jgi:kynureninase
MYLTHADVLRAAEHLHEVVTGKEYARPEYRTRATVT